MRALLIGCLLAAPAFAREAGEGEVKIAERDLREMKAMIPGHYVNEEQVYFQGNLGLGSDIPRVETIIIEDGEGFLATSSTARGERTARLEYYLDDATIRSREERDGEPLCERTFARHFDSFIGEGCGGRVVISPLGLSYGSEERTVSLDRASAFTCWVAPQKRDGKYAFRNDIVIHDGGGRQWVEGKDFDTVGIRMRHVRWPSGNNRDSRVLYIHKGDDAEWESAASYAWTEPESDRIAINLRWVQVSCTRGGEVVTPGIDLKTGSGR